MLITRGFTEQHLHETIEALERDYGCTEHRNGARPRRSWVARSPTFGTRNERGRFVA